MRERVEKEQEHRVEVSRSEEEIHLAKREMGWRVYATNNQELNLAAVGIDRQTLGSACLRRTPRQF